MQVSHRLVWDRPLVAKIETWLAGFSINDDLQKVRRQMADFIVKLLRKTQG